MKIGKNLKKLLLDEMNLIVDKMNNAKSPDEVTYYFSAVYGAVQRVFNFEYHAELVHLFVIISPLYQSLNQKFAAPAPQYDNSNPVQLSRLIELTALLRDAFKNGEELSSIIEDFAVLLYSSNGNGTYLFQRGMLKLDN
jgi:hypothetical protein